MCRINRVVITQCVWDILSYANDLIKDENISDLPFISFLVTFVIQSFSKTAFCFKTLGVVLTLPGYDSFLRCVRFASVPRLEVKAGKRNDM